MAAMYEAEAKKGIRDRLIRKYMKHELHFFCCKLGEIYELKAELNSDKRDRKKEAVKKVIESIRKKNKICL